MKSIVIALIMSFIACWIGLKVGFQNGQFRAAAEENRIALANLQNEKSVLEPQLREYLKARIYENLAAFPGSAPSEALEGMTTDNQVLKGIYTGKK